MTTLIDFDNAVVLAIPVAAGYAEPARRECMLLEGPQGWGEFSPPRDVDDRHTARWLTAAIEPGTVGWPDPVRGRVPVAVEVPALPPARAYRLVSESGCATAEVAVTGLDDSLARVVAVRDALGRAGRIRCVAPGVWDVETAVTAIRALTAAAGELEYVEPGCATLDDLAAVRRRVDVPVAVDLSRVPAEKRGSLRAYADVAVLPCSALGGVRRSLRLAEVSGLSCAVRSGRETSIGLAGAAALAGALPDLPFACTVSRPAWVTADITGTSRGLVAATGWVPVAPMPPAPEPELLHRYAVTDPGLLQWWRARLERAKHLSLG